MTQPDIVMKVARQFVERVAEQVDLEGVDRIDVLNLQEENPEICHSHDFCDANVFMRYAMIDVAGVDPAETPYLDEPVRLLRQDAWNTAKRIGFRRLSMVRGVPGIPAEEPQVICKERSVKVTLPGMNGEEAAPLEVHLDYWGRNPHLQVLCYNRADEEGEPKVCVRYNREGKVVEVLVEDVTLIKGADGKFAVRSYADTRETPWEIVRDDNPACREGDKLKMPSGLTATVMSLRSRYEDCIEQLRRYDEQYNIVARCCPDCSTVEEAWELNPLTAATVNPEDLSYVPTEQ
jgi:hypothetical protein